MQTSKTLFRIVSLALAATFIIACSKEAKKTRFLAEADSYFKASKYDKAKVSYLNVVRLDPQNALAFERIGTIWLQDGSPLRAAAFLAKANELAPKNDQNRIRLARCYLAIGRFLSILILPPRTWHWEISICSRKIRNKRRKNSRKPPSLRPFVLWSA